MDEKVKDKLRWDPYVLLKNDEFGTFIKEHFNLNSSRNILYILGMGFDFRMNKGIKSIIESNPCAKIHCVLIEFDEGKGSASRKHKEWVQKNLEELRKLIKTENIELKKIDLWSSGDKKKTRIGDQNIAGLFNDPKIFQEYTDIIVDISAFPRGLYFSLIGKIQAILDAHFLNEEKNFFLVIAENASLDAHIKESQPDAELSYVFGFRGGSELSYEKRPTIWLPILGEASANQIRTAHEKIKPDEICPVLPFPSRNPRRADDLLIEYHKLLFDELTIEGQNIIYVPEQNPFEAYRTLSETIKDYYNTLKVINGCDIVISTFSSKLLSIGALLVAYEFKAMNAIKVGVLNVDSSGYSIDPEGFEKSLHDRSELFLIWLSGQPYKL
jgi:hypothetical protein